MSTTNEQKIASAESFIGSIPDSTVKGNYERWLGEVKSKGFITSEQLGKFVSLANALPTELQNYPQEFALNVKNDTLDVLVEEVSKPTVKPKKKGK